MIHLSGHIFRKNHVENSSNKEFSHPKEEPIFFKLSNPIQMKSIFILLNSVFLLFIINQLSKMSQELDDLKDAMQKDTEVEQSAITLLNGLKAQLDAHINDPAALKELSDQLGSSADA